MTETDEVLLRAAENCAGAYRAWSEIAGRPVELHDDLSLADMGLPVALPPNNATLLRSIESGELGGMLDRTAAFFASRPGGGYEIWSVWGFPAAPAPGTFAYSTPCMVRDGGGDAPPVPPELDTAVASDARDLAAAGALVGEVFGAPSASPYVYPPEITSDDFRVWIGSVDGRVVTTAAAYAGAGFVGVYAVATAPDARGRGYGPAVTWAATLWRPDLPATLQASPMGYPVYERMGYRTVADFTVWSCPRRVGPTG